MIQAVGEVEEVCKAKELDGLPFWARLQDGVLLDRCVDIKYVYSCSNCSLLKEDDFEELAVPNEEDDSTGPACIALVS